MRLLLALILALAMGAAFASDTYRFSGGVVSVGDTIAALVQRAGKADRIVPLQNAYGAGVGERWEYYVGDKMVSFYISGGRIYRIDES